METWYSIKEAVRKSIYNHDTKDLLTINHANKLASALCVRQSCVYVHEVKPALEKEWAGLTVEKKIGLLLGRISAPLSTCRVVDRVLLTHNTEEEFLSHVRRTFLTKDLIKLLGEWARKVLLSSEVPSEVTKDLKMLGWLPHLEACFTDVVYEVVREYVQSNATKFDAPCLEETLAFVKAVPEPWLQMMLVDTDLAHLAAQRLEFFVHQAFGALRASEFFDMVTVFPESLMAIDDLKVCLQRTRVYREFTTGVKSILGKRLLHSGANTNMILLVYVRLIKTLTRLDPKGVLLETISIPVKKYLRSRPETMRCIVTALTNDGANSELHAELGLETEDDIRPVEFEYADENENTMGNSSQDNDCEDENEYAIDEDKEPVKIVFQTSSPTKLPLRKAMPGDQWEPDPVEANPKSNSHLRNSNDILGMLVRVYGSKEMFVNEYRQLLGERLLSRTDGFETDEVELRSLEMLKLRLGDQVISNCDVMIHDLAQSRRINQSIPGAAIQAMIISKNYWPDVLNSADSEFQVHQTIKQSMDDFAKRYADLKKPRKLNFVPHLGLVDLDLVFDDGTRKSYSNISPIHANLALLLSEKSEWGLTQIAAEMNINPNTAKTKLGYWVNEGVVFEGKEKNTYRLAVTAPVGGSNNQSDFAQDEEDVNTESATKMNDEANELRDAAQFNFVNTMLTNLGPSTLESIHRNLQLFSGALGEYGYTRTEKELDEFLDAYVGKGQLDVGADGRYSSIA